MQHAERKKVMISLTGGGHLWQAMSVIEGLKGDYEFIYVTPRGCIVPKERLPTGELFRVTGFTSVSMPSRWRQLVRAAKSFSEIMKAVRDVRPNIVIGVGTALAVPMLLAARLTGIPGVFIESVTRVNDLSLTGKIIMRLGLASKLYVQWPELHARYQKTIYRGSVM